MPTSYFNFQLPTFDQQSWWNTFQAMVRSIDTAVSSVAQRGIVGHVTLTISAYATASLSLFGSSTLTTACGWQTLSVAPYGRLTGNFALVEPGVALVRVSHSHTWGSLGSSTVFAGQPRFFYRLIVSPGSLNITGDSAQYNVGLFEHETLTFDPMAIASLGAGSYSIEPQLRVLSTAADSRWTMRPDDAFVLTVQAAQRG